MLQKVYSTTSKRISLNDCDLFQFHSPDPSINSFDETIPPLPPPMPPLSDPKPVKSHTPIKKRLRITDFVLHQPSSPGALSPNPSNNLDKDPTFPLPLSPSPPPSQHLSHIVRGALVQCALCKEWYHQFCCEIDDVVIDTPKYKYLCRKCTEL